MVGRAALYFRYSMHTEFEFLRAVFLDTQKFTGPFPLPSRLGYYC